MFNLMGVTRVTQPNPLCLF